MKIGIDFDGVVADSMAAILKFHNERYGTALKMSNVISFKLEEVWGGTMEEAVKKIDSFFDEDQIIHLHPIEGALKAINDLKKHGHELWIVTGRKTRDIEQTERWLTHHLPGIFNGVHYANFFELGDGAKPLKKWDICKKLGITVMIDDNLPTAIDCARVGIRSLLLDYPWNQSDEPLPPGITRIFSWSEIVREIG
jgi:uncharacterized HAD superfamily protein